MNTNKGNKAAIGERLLWRQVDNFAKPFNIPQLHFNVNNRDGLLDRFTKITRGQTVNLVYDNRDERKYFGIKVRKNAKGYLFADIANPSNAAEADFLYALNVYNASVWYVRGDNLQTRIKRQSYADNQRWSEYQQITYDQAVKHEKTFQPKRRINGEDAFLTVASLYAMNKQDRPNVVGAQEKMHRLLVEKKDLNINNLEKFGKEAKNRIDGVKKPKPLSVVCKECCNKLWNTCSTAWHTFWKKSSSSSKKPDNAITDRDDDSSDGFINREELQPKYRQPPIVGGNENDNTGYNINTLRNALPSKTRKKTLLTLKEQQLNSEERANYQAAKTIVNTIANKYGYGDCDNNTLYTVSQKMKDWYNDDDDVSLNYDDYGKRPKSLNGSLIVNDFSTNPTPDYEPVLTNQYRTRPRSNSYNSATGGNSSHLNAQQGKPTLKYSDTIGLNIKGVPLDSDI